jgi:hypothetical protein
MKSEIRTFRSRLREDLKDSAFKAHYLEQRQALQRAMEFAKRLSPCFRDN